MNTDHKLSPISTTSPSSQFTTPSKRQTPIKPTTTIHTVNPPFMALISSTPYPFSPLARRERTAVRPNAICTSPNQRMVQNHVHYVPSANKHCVCKNSHFGRRKCVTRVSLSTEVSEPESGAEEVNWGRILLSDVVVKRRRRVYWGRKWNSRDVGNATVITAMHLLSIFAPFQFNWAAFWTAVTLYVVTGLFGITLSFHRNLSHRSFKLPKWLEYLFAYCGVQALQVGHL